MFHQFSGSFEPVAKVGAMAEARGLGSEMYGWMKELFPLNRSLTGDGVRQTLNFFKGLLPNLELTEVPSGTHVLDWTVPPEWRIRHAYIADTGGNRLIDFEESNLHVVGYSEPVRGIFTLDEIEGRLHSVPEQPDAVPYVTSYYSRTWGFCLSENQRSRLGPGPFQVEIDSDLFEGSMTYGEVLIPGDSQAEILFSTYICHPSMANNELSGPVVATALARYVQELENRKFSYRFLFAPETIGAIAYIARHGESLKQRVRAGWVVTCVGDNRNYSYLPSRLGSTMADRISLKVFEELGLDFNRYSFLDRGSDERQWCSAMLDLPVCSIMRSKYGTYPEYHTSLDDLDFVSADGLEGSFRVLAKCVERLENTDWWEATSVGEPQLGRRGLYQTLSKVGSSSNSKELLDVLAYCDGTRDVIEISDLVGRSVDDVEQTLGILLAGSMVRR